jgi:hypothetical protein
MYVLLGNVHGRLRKLMHSGVVIVILMECEIREKKLCATQCNELRGKEEKRR